MAFHSKELEHFVARHPEAATSLFFVMIVVSVVLGLVAAAMFVKDYIGRTRAQSALIRQHECTRTAERRSLNKSSAIATASHDIRGSLGGITSLIDMCYDRVPSGCEVEENLRLMRRLANDLLGLLNTLLDASKIEAGKMELEDDEFSLAELLEEVTDFYHPMAMKKGIEVVLDLCDGSAIKFTYVRGDRIKLKQILSNLVSNAVKFTSKGSICIGAWAKKPSFERTILASNPNRCLSLLSRVFLRDEDIIDKSEGISAPQQKPNCMEYIIEVDDTGKGIPKDKQKSVFENFVQVRDSSLGHHGGTGLGLGIVQSLVRLMGGDIGIVDKEPGKEGTCFKFNIFLEAGDRQQTGGGERVREVDVEAPAESSQLANAPQPHKYDGSSVVVLLIHNNERRRVVKKYMERNGVRVSVVRHWEYLQGHLRRMKTTMYLSQNSSSSKSDYTSQSDYMSMRSASCKYAGKEVPLSSLDGTDEVQQRAGSRRVNRCAPTFILFLIDVTARSFQEMVSVVKEFQRELCNNVSSKVIWLEKPAEGCKGLVESLRREDAIMSKPLHGSRLHRVLRTLPEFGGFSSIGNGEASSYLIKRKAKGIRIEENNNLEIQEHEGWNSDDEIRPINERRAKGFQANHPETTGLSENGVRPLSGLKILVAEDSPLLASLADRMLSFLGAVVQIKQNGKLALEAIVNGLEVDQVPEGSSKRIPFDLILMDCEMPEMNGFEATREIRRAEQPYGIHIPIVALTAHVSSDQVEETALAGMDAYLAKPVEKDSLVETVTRLCRPQMAA
uniref:histidine kinase n=1 Tax=Kalanchoe fedtschenkoi TaxID=63787 RepID=A0A7N0TS59_KALFE